MKKKIIITLLLVGLSNLYTASYVSSKLVTYIGKSNFMSIGATTLDSTLSINTAGTYVLTEDIASALTTNQVININTDNVTLDLNGFTITGQNNSDMNGIEVATGKRNIVIKNGTIYSVGNSGIKVNGSVQNINISNIIFNNCNGNSGSQSGGIALIGASGTEIEHCVIDNCVTFSIVPQTTDAYGIYAKNTNYLTIKNTKAESVRNIGKSHTATGFHLEDCKYPTIKESSVYNSQGDSTATGVYVLTCTSPHISNCTAEGSIANDVAGSSNPGTGYGFYLEDANNGLIEGCSAYNNQGYSAGVGFCIASCSADRIIHCFAQGNHSTNSSGTGTSKGFGLERANNKGATQNCILRHCTAIGQYSLNSFAGASGFYLEDAIKRCIIEYCVAAGNDGGSTGIGAGIYLSGSATFLNVIKNNQIFSNTAAASSEAYGIYEDTGSSTSETLFYENISGLNTGSDAVTGKDLSSATNSFIATIANTTQSFNSDQVNTAGYNTTIATVAL